MKSYFTEAIDYILKSAPDVKEFYLNPLMSQWCNKSETVGLLPEQIVLFSFGDFTQIGDTMEYELGYLKKIDPNGYSYILTKKGREARQEGGHEAYLRWQHKKKNLPFASKRIAFMTLIIASLAFILSVLNFIYTHNIFNVQRVISIDTTKDIIENTKTIIPKR